MKVEKLLVLSLLLATSMGATAQEVLLNSAGKVGEFEFPSQNEASAKAKAPAADDKEYMIKYSGNSDLFFRTNALTYCNSSAS